MTYSLEQQQQVLSSMDGFMIPPNPGPPVSVYQVQSTCTKYHLFFTRLFLFTPHDSGSSANLVLLAVMLVTELRPRTLVFQDIMPIVNNSIATGHVNPDHSVQVGLLTVFSV